MDSMPLPIQHLPGFCHRWKIEQFGVVGSMARGDARPDSDVDVVVQFAPDAPWSLFDIVRMRDELAAMFGRPVDIIEESAVRNPYMRDSIRRTKRVLYAA